MKSCGDSEVGSWQLAVGSSQREALGGLGSGGCSPRREGSAHALGLGRQRGDGAGAADLGVLDLGHLEVEGLGSRIDHAFVDFVAGVSLLELRVGLDGALEDLEAELRIDALFG